MATTKKSKYSYLRLGEAATSFHCSASGLKIINKQVVRYSPDENPHIESSPIVKMAIQSGHICRCTEQEYNEASSQVTVNGRGEPDTVVNDGKRVPTDDERARKNKTSKADTVLEEEETDDDDEGEDDDEEEEETDEEGEGLDEDEEVELTALLAKESLSRKEKKRKKALLTKKG